MNEKFAFLASTRFWVAIIGAVAIYLQQEGFLNENAMQLITTIAGVFIGIKTIDRFGEKVGK